MRVLNFSMLAAAAVMAASLRRRVIGRSRRSKNSPLRMAPRSPESTVRGRTFRLAMLLLLLCVRVQAGDFEKANDLYDSGHFAEAKKLYEKLWNSGERSANLSHNLGNAEYRTGSPGRAALGYERALAMEPRHAEARANLAFVREQTRASGLDVSLTDRVFRWFSADVWTVIGVVVAWGVLFSLAAIFTTARATRGSLWFATIAGVAIVACAISGVRLHQRDRALAIVTAKEIEAHLAPVKSAALAGVLPAGSRVRILSERGPWILCELPGERRGWLEAGSIERIDPSRS